MGGTRALGRWIGYFEEYPPYEELWHMTASICCAIYRAAGDKRCQPKDFLPKRNLSRAQSADALAAKMRQVFGGMTMDAEPQKKAKH